MTQGKPIKLVQRGLFWNILQNSIIENGISVFSKIHLGKIDICKFSKNRLKLLLLFLQKAWSKMFDRVLNTLLRVPNSMKVLDCDFKLSCSQQSWIWPLIFSAIHFKDCSVTQRNCLKKLLKNFRKIDRKLYWSLLKLFM